MKINVGFTGLLFLIFLVLKLANIVAWSWWWIFAPLYVVPLLVFGFLLVCGLVVVIADWLSYK